MVFNRKIILSLLAILALLSFGFNNLDSARMIADINGPPTIRNLPAGLSRVVTARYDDCDDRPNSNCNDGDADDSMEEENLLSVKVSPQLAGFCALYKKPGGTQVVSVNGVYAELAYPYYKVVLDIPDGGNPTVYVNATNCNIIPQP